MRVEDAEVLFKSKINWTAVYSENKIYCVEPGCDYFTMIDNGELTNHMIKVHKYEDYPCTNDHCDYVATSKVKQTSFITCESQLMNHNLSLLEKFDDAQFNAHEAI